jgi:hypothetical protein
VAGVQFEDGKGSTDNESAIAYFRRQGYTVDGSTDTGLEDQVDTTQVAPAVLGNVIVNPPGPLDAADPDNDLVPVGGVKSAAAPEAPEPSKKAQGRRKANTTDTPADITPQAPVAANGGVQSANSATTATTPGAAPQGDTTAADVTVVTPAPDPTKPAVTDADPSAPDAAVLTDGTPATEAAKAPTADQPAKTATDAQSGSTTKGA